MAKSQRKMHFLNKLGDIYENSYKKLMIIPAVLVLFFLGVLVYNQVANGYIVEQDISLKGGTAITFYSNQTFALDFLEQKLSEVFETEDVSARELKDIYGNLVGYDLQVGKEINTTSAFSTLGSAFGIVLDPSNTSINQQSAQLAKSFFRDAMWAFLIAFVLMAAVIYFYFKSIVPAISIILSTVSDIICILGVFALFKIKMSIATIGALLMIIGYSVDSDILLATNIIKRREGRLMDRIKHAIKTELMMDLAAFVTYLIMLLFSNVGIIKHIAFVLFIAIFFDIINTWIQNAGLQRIYVERRGK